jgi:hypothetical protein
MVAAALQRLDNQAALGFANQPTADVLVNAGKPLLYDDGERVVLPAEFAGQLCLLVDGELADDLGARGRGGHGLTREASLTRLKGLLAEHIGPFASYAVDQAAANDAKLATVCDAVAAEIEDESQRAHFLAAANIPAEDTYRPGLLFRTRTESARIVSQRPLRAVGHALILVAPEWAVRGEPQSRA